MYDSHIFSSINEQINVAKIDIFSIYFMTYFVLIDLLLYIETKNSYFSAFYHVSLLLLNAAFSERCLISIVVTFVWKIVCIVCIEFNIVFNFFRNTINKITLFDFVVVLFDALRDAAFDALKCSTFDAMKSSTVERLMMNVINNSCLKSASLMNFNESIETNRSDFDARSSRLFNENLSNVMSVKR